MNACSACFHPELRIPAFVARNSSGFGTAGQGTFSAACSDGNWPRWRVSFRSRAFTGSVRFVVSMTRLTSGGNAGNGVNSARCARRSLTIAGYRPPRAPARACRAAAAAGSPRVAG